MVCQTSIIKYKHRKLQCRECSRNADDVHEDRKATELVRKRRKGIQNSDEHNLQPALARMDDSFSDLSELFRNEPVTEQ